MHITTDDFITQRVLSGASYTASWGTAAVGALTVSDLAILIGLLLALGTYITNWIYQARRDRRDAEQHRLQKELLEKQLHEFEKH